MERTTAMSPPPFLAAMVARMTATTAELRAWATAAPRTLAELEQQALVAAQGLGNALLAGLCAGLAATPAERGHPCACGHPARYCRQRPAQVTTPLGPIAIARLLHLHPLRPRARAAGSAAGLPRGQHQRGVGRTAGAPGGHRRLL